VAQYGRLLSCSGQTKACLPQAGLSYNLPAALCRCYSLLTTFYSHSYAFVILLYTHIISVASNPIPIIAYQTFSMCPDCFDV
jgi:hypothetical protein